ncbi:hypothetical protein AK812_SmicGene25921 [Symbiodinium microadriaticum]|uniref:Transmembrane protein n=1 Tax=Symbiodinium microadriaticum TaxID=2951 RepID=A0A1Q9DAR7_SYMMI|nr:hypothetical protein AK812_SmicGene25921 [Symbiodinium microadriaticum]
MLRLGPWFAGGGVGRELLVEVSEYAMVVVVVVVVVVVLVVVLVVVWWWCGGGAGGEGVQQNRGVKL